MSSYLIKPILATLIGLALVSPGQCFPSGAPNKACANLYPKHGGVNSLIGNAPYSVSVSPTLYAPGDVITVTLSANPGSSFKGFIVIANRINGDTEENVGNFINPPATAKPLFWYPQQDSYENCVTHRDATEKTSVSLQWTTPVSMGNIMFRATFVTSLRVFYVDLKSPRVTAMVASSDPPFNSTVSTNFDDMILSDTCASTKGCMLFPSVCSREDCPYAVAYTDLSDSIMFEVKAKSVGYVTMALSADKFMGEDEAVTCTQSEDGDFVSVQHGYNPAYFNDKHRITQLTEIQTTRSDGYLYCRWRHPYLVSHTHLVTNPDGSISKQIKSFDLRQPFHIFLAWGSLYAGADVLGKHKEHPIISINPVNLRENQVARGSSLPIEVKIHATLMLLAWMLLMGISVVIARHYRNPLSLCCGKAAWFQTHLTLNIVSFLLVVAAFILIFVKVKKFSTTAYHHAILGVVTTALMVIQVIAGLARPSPEARHRPAFNIFHSLWGAITRGLAVATIMLSAYSNYMNLELRRYLVITFAVWIGMQVIWEVLVFETIKRTRPKIVLPNDDNLNSKTAVFTLEEKEPHVDNTHSRGMKAAQALHTISLLALTLSSLIFIWVF